MKRTIFVSLSFFLMSVLTLCAQSTEPLPFKTLREARPGTRWWWMGSAVDKENLRWNLDEYARAGIGAVEITPLYGVQGNEAHELRFLSPEWMQALRDVQEIAAEKGIEVDMNNGTGWPFGGPEVPIEEAACKAVFIDTLIQSEEMPDVKQITLEPPVKERPYARLSYIRAFPTNKPQEWRIIAVYESRTRQQVKRAAPGGEGYVIDHFDRMAVKHYLERFERTFAQTGTPYPHTFFNDSYEVYGANWTPTLFEEFAKRRGYRLEDKLPELLGFHDDSNRTLSDYRETLSDLLYENFTRQWVEWAHSHGVQVRNQAHGSPANLLDLYAAVDIPETEGFGLSEFGIRGLRTDPGMTKKNFSDVSMLKYASSAAHVTGKPFTSSETFTWLTEHFRTSLSQMKPDLDLMFTCGINHVFFHGSCYTPKNDPWPGWKFYASIDMSPTNSIWRDAPYLMQYIERCQTFLQAGQPDNDFLVYLPVHDMWKKRLKKGADGLLMQFDIHSMNEKAPEFIRSILTIDSLGYDCDYISDSQLEKVIVKDGYLITEGGTRYKALIIPTGTTVSKELAALMKKFTPYVINGEDEQALARFCKAEPMKRDLKLHTVRRKNDKGYHYFIANLTPDDVEGWTSLAVNTEKATWFHPMNGETTPATIKDGKLYVSLKSGESGILVTGNIPLPSHNPSVPPTLPSFRFCKRDTIDLTYQPWTLSFTEEAPKIGETYQLNHLQTWETLDDATKVVMGTGIYTTNLSLTQQQAKQRWQINLGDVRESARVYINGQFIGCAWAAPYILDCKQLFHKGNNTIRIEVTNLPANRIADMDRRGIPWRKMKEINVVDINYKKTTYEGWAPMPSGLNSTVILTATH